MKTYLSLGAGVQSSTMALMAARGEIEAPEAAIFADTQAEPQSVYDWLDWLEGELPYPVHRVTAGSLTEAVLDFRTTKDGRRFTKTDIPFFTVNHDGDHGMIRQRACTYYYKIRPILKAVRELARVKRGTKTPVVRQLIGISLDEAVRMKPSREKWAENAWPLIDLRMSRADCIRWMERNNYPKPPRSSCYYCPYHNDHEWRRLRDEEPEYFQKAVEFERQVQALKAETDNFKTTPYLHASRVPLDQVDFSTDLDRGQLSLFGNECEGMCGV